MKLALAGAAGIASIIIASLAVARPAPRPRVETLAQRAARHGLPSAVQDLIDRAEPRRDASGRCFIEDRFAGLRGRYDLAPALIERLEVSPYAGLGRDLADLDSSVALDRARAIALDRSAPFASRREATFALARASTPRVVLDGKSIGRTGDAGLWIGWSAWPPEGARVARSPYRFDPELTQLLGDADASIRKAAAAALTSAIAAR